MQSQIHGSRVLVTGAAGYIGSRLLGKLLSLGATCTAVVRSQDDKTALAGLALDIVEFDSPSDLGPVVARQDPKFIIHLGAFVTTSRTLDVVTPTLEWNVISTLSLLHASVGSSCIRLVAMGSCEEYGRVAGKFMESMAPAPVSPYSASKAACTAYTLMFAETFHVPAVVLRPAVVYGPGQPPRMLIPQVAEALVNEKPVDVTPGQQTRDFVHVDDLICAIIAALSPSPEITGKIFNIGSGEIVSVRSCVELLEQISGTSGLVRYGGRDYSPNEIFQYEPCIDRATNVLKFQSKVSLNEGLRQVVEHCRNHKRSNKENE